MRAMNLANALVAAGHHVTLWSSAFYHQEKRHRSRHYRSIVIHERLEIRLIPSPGYATHIGPGRLWDHALLALNLRKSLSAEACRPDVAFVGYPPIEFAFVAVDWLKARNIPVMLDVKDQWPQIFVAPLWRPLRPLARLALAPYYYLGKKTMRAATAFSAMAQSFLEWVSDFSGRPLAEWDRVVPLVPVVQPFSNENTAAAIRWWNEHGISDDGRPRFFYVGSFMKACDFQPVIKAARQAHATGLDWQFVICGDGARANQLSAVFSELPNVVLPGWVDRVQALTLANISLAGLMPFQNTNDYMKSIPNKVADYLSFGKPIVSSLKGEVAALLQRHDIGLFYDDSQGNGLFDILAGLCHDRAKVEVMSANAMATYKKLYDGEKVYLKLTEHLEMLSKVRMPHATE